MYSDSDWILRSVQKKKVGQKFCSLHYDGLKLCIANNWCWVVLTECWQVKSKARRAESLWTSESQVIGKKWKSNITATMRYHTVVNNVV